MQFPVELQAVLNMLSEWGRETMADFRELTFNHWNNTEDVGNCAIYAAHCLHLFKNI